MVKLNPTLLRLQKKLEGVYNDEKSLDNEISTVLKAEQRNTNQSL